MCSLKNSQNFFIQYLHQFMFKLCFFLNENIADIEKPDGICLLTFVVDECLGLSLHLSIFFIKNIHNLHK